MIIIKIRIIVLACGSPQVLGDVARSVLSEGLNAGLFLFCIVLELKGRWLQRSEEVPGELVSGAASVSGLNSPAPRAQTCTPDLHPILTPAVLFRASRSPGRPATCGWHPAHCPERACPVAVRPCWARPRHCARQSGLLRFACAFKL